AHRQPERIARDLREDGLEPLPQRRRADVDRDRAAGAKRELCVFARARAAAFDEAGERQSMMAAFHELALESLLLIPAEAGEAGVECGGIVAGVVLGRRLVWHELPDRIRHLGLLNQVLAPEC